VSDAGRHPFVEAGDAEAGDAALADAVRQGEMPELIAALVGALSGETAWRRQRLLDLLAQVDPEPLLEPLGEGLHDAGSPARRNAARMALGVLARKGSRDPAAARRLLESLARADADPDARILSLVALGESGNRDARRGLERLLGDADPNVGAAAAEALGSVGDVDAVPALLRTVEKAGFWVQSAALATLGRLGDRRAVPVIVSAAEEPELAEAAAAALGEIGDPAGMEGIRRALSATPRGQWEPILEAAASLAGSDDRVPIPQWLREAALSVEEVVAAGFADHPSDERARILGFAGSESATAALAAGLRSPDSSAQATVGLRHLPERLREQAIVPALSEVEPGERAELLSLLPPLAERSCIELVAGFLGDASAEVCAEAAAALARTADRPAREAAEEALQREGSRAGALHALGLMTDTPRETFAAALDDDDPRVRDAAGRSLGRRSEPEAVPALIRALESERHTSVRQTLLRALGSAGTPEAIDALLDRRLDEDPAIRYAVARGLGRAGDPRGYDPLVEALDDASSEVRLGAMQALGELGDARAASLLAGRLSSPDADVRRAAAEALASVATAEQADALVSALGDDEWQVRIAAVRALARLDRRHAREPLRRVAASDPDPLVRETASRALSDRHS
jgi:HEAT repeat protein